MYVIRQLIWGLVAFSIWPAYKFLFSSGSPTDTYYYLIGLILVVTIVREAIQVRVSHIEFNSDTQQIIFYFETLFSRKKQRVLKFKFAKLEFDTKTSWRGTNLVIYFLSNKVEIFKVDKGKDGFSSESLLNIKDTASRLSLPISKY
jgi:hypothetical protein